MERSNVEIVKAAYDAFGRGDLVAFLGLMSDDCTWELPGAPQVPWAGKFRGPAEIKQFVIALGNTVDFQVFQPRSFVGSADRVVVLGYEIGTMRTNDKSYETHWAHAFTLAGGKITRFQEYIDTAALIEALG